MPNLGSPLLVDFGVHVTNFTTGLLYCHITGRISSRADLEVSSLMNFSIHKVKCLICHSFQDWSPAIST
jgi:hypothetical protein